MARRVCTVGWIMRTTDHKGGTQSPHHRMARSRRGPVGSHVVSSLAAFVDRRGLGHRGGDKGDCKCWHAGEVVHEYPFFSAAKHPHCPCPSPPPPPPLLRPSAHTNLWIGDSLLHATSGRVSQAVQGDRPSCTGPGQEVDVGGRSMYTYIFILGVLFAQHT